MRNVQYTPLPQEFEPAKGGKQLKHCNDSIFKGRLLHIAKMIVRVWRTTNNQLALVGLIKVNAQIRAIDNHINQRLHRFRDKSGQIEDFTGKRRPAVSVIVVV